MNFFNKKDVELYKISFLLIVLYQSNQRILIFDVETSEYKMLICRLYVKLYIHTYIKQ